MGLPAPNTEKNFVQTKLPSGKTIGVCGWKVSEEKELLFVMEVDENPDENKMTHIINLLRDCVDDKAKFDSVSENDLIKIGIEARKKAKGETIEYNYGCPHCGNKFFDEVNLTNEQVIKYFDPSPLTINENLILTFKDLEWKKVELLYKAADGTAKFTFNHIVNAIDSFTIDGETYTEFTPQEAEAWIDSLESDEMKKIYTGFESKLSTCYLQRKINCIKCKEEIDIDFGDILSFLVL
jgi:hypothetical protein